MDVYIGGNRVQWGVRAGIGLAVFGLMALVSAASYGASAESAPQIQPQAAGFVGLWQLRQIEPGLDGDGVRIGVLARSKTYQDGQPRNDYRPNINHPSLANARLSFFDNERPSPGICEHSTAVCSILVGQDKAGWLPGLGRFVYQGIVPRAQLDIYELCYYLANPLIGLTKADLDLLTISSGFDFEDWWTRALDAMAEQQGLLVVASIGNGRSSLHPLLYPGASCNALGVGVVDPIHTDDLAVATSNFWLPSPENSSCGPTADGRCKPDLVAPGSCIVASAKTEGGYELAPSGSSFATPIVAGIAAILIQKARQEPQLAVAITPQTSGLLLKAILMNSAIKLPYWHKGRVELSDDHLVPLDYAQGAGLVDAVGAYQQLMAGRSGPGTTSPIGWDINTLDRADRQLQVYQMDIPDQKDVVIAATLVWNVHYGSSFPFLSTGQSDLRLELWGIDPQDRQRDTLLDYSDSPVDNVEHIYIRADGHFTRYQLVVSWSGRKAQDMAQEAYAIAWWAGQRPQQKRVLWEDLNGDGLVDQRDCTRLLQNWATSVTSPGRYLIGDINSDGLIDRQDLQIISTRAGLQMP